MNAYRKLARIIAVGALTCLAVALSPAFAQGHSGGGGGHSSGGGGAHAHYAAGGRGGYAGSHYAGGYRGGAYYGHGGYYGHGYYGGYYGRGGWYGGRFYGPGFGWFLPVLPAFYATYWFGGIPYYYANDAYYTWSPDYNGYVATNPPADATPDAGAAPDANDATPPPPAGQTYNYPKNGQTDEQQASDRYQCHQWAVSQSGYDPTRNGAANAGQDNYRRAVTACMEGRGYSVR
jgi:hypothetical protein